tara:strand:+ start:74 stop:850 length:777 start_codon:yes stop_codon:yes gene_type:complete
MRKKLKGEIIRLCIGPWHGKYSSVWNVISNPKNGDFYIGVRVLAKVMKITFHPSGKCRVAFVDSYNQKLVENGKDPLIDRAFLKWEKGDVPESTIRQILDIHFPLSVLSLNEKPKIKGNKKIIFIQPDEKSLGENDTITMKVLFHKVEPESDVLYQAMAKRKVIPAFYSETINQEYMTIAYEYSKKLPISITDKEQKGYAEMIRGYFLRADRQVGDRMEGLSLQLFEMGLPPSVTNIGTVSAFWESEKHFSINIGQQS